jgi:glycosyltransferase involved in cell wall biosynthesis
MRVLMTTDTVGGVWTYTRELVQGLLQAGCDVTLISMGRKPSCEQQTWAGRTLAQSPKKFRYIPTEFALEWMQDGAQCYSESCEFMLSCIAAYSPDILHCNQFCYGALPVAIPKLIVAHSDVLSWWRACRGTEAHASSWLKEYRRLVNTGLHQAECVVAPTEWMREQLLQNYGSLPLSLVIANGRTVDSYSSATKVLRAVTAGRLWDEGKNVLLLEDIDCVMPVCIAGDIRFNQADGRDLKSGKIELLGAMNEDALLQLFSESAIYVVTSRYEPFGLAAVEAALCGCAIIANDIPPLREVWGDTAVYFAENDARSLNSKLKMLGSQPQLLQNCADAARARAERLYSSDRMTQEYLALYQQLVTQRDTQYVA